MGPGYVILSKDRWKGTQKKLLHNYTSKSSMTLFLLLTWQSATDKSWSLTKETSLTVKSRFHESYFQICREPDLLQCQKPWLLLSPPPQIRVNICLVLNILLICQKHFLCLNSHTHKKKIMVIMQAERCLLYTLSIYIYSDRLYFYSITLELTVILDWKLVVKKMELRQTDKTCI